MEGDSYEIDKIIDHDYDKGKLVFEVKYVNATCGTQWQSKADLVKGSAVLVCNYLKSMLMDNEITAEVKRKFWKQVKPETVPKDYFSVNWSGRPKQTVRKSCGGAGPRKILKRKS